MSDIKLFVTHTPNRNTMRIDNPLFCNVIAGSDFQKNPVPAGVFKDNVGENISSKNKYSDYARSGIGKQLGFNESDSKKILSFSEIKRIVERLNLEKDKEALDLICKLFSLPDNKYVFFAEEYIKRNIRNENALKELRERYASTTGKIRERLDYVINQ